MSTKVTEVDAPLKNLHFSDIETGELFVVVNKIKDLWIKIDLTPKEKESAYPLNSVSIIDGGMLHIWQNDLVFKASHISYVLER